MQGICPFSDTFSELSVRNTEMKVPARGDFPSYCPLFTPSSSTCWPICLFFQAVIFSRKEASLWPHGKSQSWAYCNIISKTGFCDGGWSWGPNLLMCPWSFTLRGRVPVRLQVTAPGDRLQPLHNPPSLHRCGQCPGSPGQRLRTQPAPFPLGRVCSWHQLPHDPCHRHGVCQVLQRKDRLHLLSWGFCKQAALTLDWMRFPAGSAVLKCPRTTFRDQIPISQPRNRLKMEGPAVQLHTGGLLKAPYYPCNQALVSDLTNWSAQTPTWGCSVRHSY